MASLELDRILERAFVRVKERWVKAGLTLILSTGIILGATLVFAIASGALAFIFLTLLKPLAILGVILAFLVFLGGVVWTSAWSSLAYAKTIVSESQIGPFKALSEARALALPYAIFLVLYFFFMLGLLPYLAIPFILWSIWGALYLYVFLAEPKAREGLKPLWRSRDLVKGNSLKILLIFLLFLGIEILGLIFSLSRSSIISLLWYLFSVFFISPFSVSVYWEIYKDLAAQKREVKISRSVVSLVFSIIGLLFIIGLFVAAAKGVSRATRRMNLKRFIQKIEREKRIKRYPYKFKNKTSAGYNTSYY